MRTQIRNTAFFLSDLRIALFADWDTQEICGFEICGFEICEFEICGFEICGLIISHLWISNLRTGRPQKFADFRLENKPKNFRICDLWTNKKICVPTFVDLLLDTR